MSKSISIVLAAALLALGGCSKGGGEGKGPGGKGPGGPGMGRGPTRFPVQVAEVEKKDVVYAVSAVGTVEAFERVQVTARVAGAVEKVDFAEGWEVKKGQVLAEVEPARFKLAVDAARAALEKAQAEQEEAQAALARREAVDKESPGLIRGEELETFRTRARTAQAEAQARRVALEQAQLNLRDAYVRAPVAGLIETRTVQTGQYVQPGAVLATLVRRDPLLVRFRVPELDAVRLSSGMTIRFTTGEAQQPFEARINHVSQAADPKTRMVELTAEVTDERRATLRPGSFASVTVPVSSEEAPVIPQTAVRPSERGFLAFVVDEQQTAHERVVTLGMRTPQGEVEVKKGLSPGELLVVRGAEALKDGVKVQPSGAPQPDGSGRSELAPRGLDGGQGKSAL